MGKDKRRIPLSEHLDLSGVGFIVLAIIVGITLVGIAEAIWSCQ